jgi:RHS repeat-associated protein
LKKYTPITGDPTTYRYDPSGNRIQKATGTKITDIMNDLCNPTGYSQPSLKRTGNSKTYYTHGLSPISQSVDTANPQYFLYDGHGSVRQLTDQTGAQVGNQNFWYDAWGNELTGNASQTVYQYSGQQHDAESGLYYLRARQYDPKNRRFTTTDPWAGSMQDPQSLHKYLYCYGDPINGIDPTGQMTLTEKLVVLGFMMNVMNLSIDTSRAIYHGIEGNEQESAEAWTWAIYDTLALSLPYSGPGGAAARGGSAVAVNAMNMSKAGIEASAILSYIRMMANVSNAAEEVGSSPSSGGSDSSGPSGGKFKETEGPGSWYELNYWNVNAAKYQSLRNGRPLGWDFYYNKVKFDGFRDGALLECKYNWKGLVSRKKGEFYGFIKHIALKQAVRQRAASNGMKVIWECSDQEVAEAFKRLFKENNIPFEVRCAPAN